MPPRPHTRPGTNMRPAQLSRPGDAKLLQALGERLSELTGKPAIDRSLQESYELALLQQLLAKDGSGVINVERVESRLRLFEGEAFNLPAFEAAGRAVLELSLGERIVLSRRPRPLTAMSPSGPCGRRALCFMGAESATLAV